MNLYLYHHGMGTDFFFESFINYLSKERGYSAHSIKAYSEDLSDFGLYLEGEYPRLELSALDRRHIRKYLSDGMSAGYHPSTLNRRLSALRSWCKFLNKKGLLTNNPTAGIEGVKTPKRITTWVAEPQMVKLLVEGESNTFETQLDQLILELLYGTGLRVSEACGLRWADVDFDQQQIKVLGKRNKERLVPITDVLKKKLLQYREEQQQAFASIEYVLLTYRGKQATARFVYEVVRKQLSTVSTLQKRSPHVLRHTYATHLLDNGAELNAIKELLGHSSLAATQIYTHNSIERLKEVYQKAHPKS